MSFTPSTVPFSGTAGLSGVVDTAAMINLYDRDHPRLVVDPVAAAASAEPIVQWRQETAAYRIGIVQQRSVDELERGKCNRLGKPLSQRSPNGGVTRSEKRSVDP